MKFVDEARIAVSAGRGGDGSPSFHRARNLPRGGPDGGDGGDGGSIVLQAVENTHTLVDFRYQRSFKAANGGPGGGTCRTGRNGADLVVKVPIGTRITDSETGTLIGDMKEPGQLLPVAKGGAHGLGNTRFKSSINRSPRKTTQGKPGEDRTLLLQLLLPADVGLVGMPNSGKSTLLAALSAATPKIADYPFTTLTPNLGVVRVSMERSFVMIDVPGLIAGAATGSGLGLAFLRHTARSRLHLHLLDIAPIDGSDPVSHLTLVEQELAAFSPALAERERWLVLTQSDKVPEGDRSALVQDILERSGWEGPWLCISAVSGDGLVELQGRVMDRILSLKEQESRDPEIAEQMVAHWEQAFWEACGSCGVHANQEEEDETSHFHESLSDAQFADREMSSQQEGAEQKKALSSSIPGPADPGTSGR